MTLLVLLWGLFALPVRGIMGLRQFRLNLQLDLCVFLALEKSPFFQAGAVSFEVRPLIFKFKITIRI